MSDNEHGGCISVFPPGRPDTIKHDTFALHDWRLLSREWVVLYGKSLKGWQETWYCTRCRKIEERRT